MPRRNPSRAPGRRQLAPGGVTKPCLFPSCGRRTAPSMIACPDDWARLPARLQAAWNAARADGDAAETDRVLAAIQKYARNNTTQREEAPCHHQITPR